MKSILSFIIVMLISTSLSASELGKVVLLTSIQSPKGLFHSDSYWAENEVEKIFDQAFSKSGYQIEMIRHANAWHLFQALHDPETVGVFWLSHAAAPQKLGSILSISDAIVSYDGFDVKTLFQDVGPSVRFLAVIGCSDQQTLNRYREQGYYAQNPLLQIVSFEDKVQPSPALIYSLNQSIDSLGDFQKSDYGPDGRHPSGDPDWKHDSIPTIRTSAAKVRFSPPKFRTSSPQDLIVTWRVPSDADENALSELVMTSQGHFLSILPKPAPGEFQQVRISANSTDMASIERVLVSAHPNGARADFRGLKIQSADRKTIYSPLSFQGKTLGTDSILFLTK